MQASPNFGKACHPHKSLIIFATEGFVFNEWEKQEGENQRVPPYAPLEEILTAQDGSNKRRTKIHSRPDQVYPSTLRTKRASGQSSSRKHGEAAERCTSEGRERKRNGSARQGAHGTGKLGALSQRLLTGWRDRRQSVSEPPRSKRDSKLIASLISATREPT